MTTAVIDETELLRRRNAALAKLEQLKAERRPIAFAAESGDDTAKTRLLELATEIGDQEHAYNSAAAAAEHLRQIAAEQRQAEIEQKQRDEIARKQAAEDDYQAALVERDNVAIDELDAVLAAAAALMRKAVEVGRRVDAARAQTGRPTAGNPQWVDTPRRMAIRLHGVLSLEMVHVAPVFSQLFTLIAPNADPIPSLANPPSAPTMSQLPDHFRPRTFDVTGPNVRATAPSGSVERQPS